LTESLTNIRTFAETSLESKCDRVEEKSLGSKTIVQMDDHACTEDAQVAQVGRAGECIFDSVLTVLVCLFLCLFGPRPEAKMHNVVHRA